VTKEVAVNACRPELGLPFSINGRVVVPYQESAQEFISRLQTKLTVLRIYEPTLEDAYIEFLDKTEKVAA